MSEGKWKVSVVGNITVMYREGADRAKITFKVPEDKKDRTFSREKEFWLTFDQINDLIEALNTSR